VSLVETALLRFEDVETGLVLTSERVFTASDLDCFAGLSGDYNPLHIESASAKEAGFKDRTVYGFLMAALLSGISGSSFHHSVCAAVSLDFVQPAFPGERIMVSAEVAHVQPSIRSIVLKVRLTRGDDLIARGKLTTKFL
jgi:3-hydroxybutyryl-CoA dehydratase